MKKEHRLLMEGLYEEREGQSGLLELDKAFSKALQEFRKQELDGEGYEAIFASRFGLFGHQKLPLRHMAKMVASTRSGGNATITGERVRQIAADLIGRFCKNYMPIDKREASDIISSNLDLVNGDCYLNHTLGMFTDLGDEAPQVLKRIDHMLHFFSQCFQCDIRALRDTVLPDYPISALHEFWAEYNPGITGDDPWEVHQKVVQYFEDNVSYQSMLLDSQSKLGHLQARNAFFSLVVNDHIYLSDDTGTIHPYKLPGPYAIGHVAHEYPQGTGWSTLYEQATKYGKPDAKNKGFRQDGAIHTAVDNGYIYQSARGTFAPYSDYLLKIRGIDLPREDVKADMTTPKSVVKATRKLLLDYAERTGERYAPLSYFYNENPDVFGHLDYYVVRQSAREIGSEMGLFFNGRSGNDVVSLDDDKDRLSNQDMIVRNYSDGTMFTTKDLSGVLRNSTRMHANLLIHTMIANGKVVRIDRDHYQVAAVANKGIKSEEFLPDIIKDVTVNAYDSGAFQGLYDKVFKKYPTAKKLQSSEHLRSIIRANYTLYTDAVLRFTNGGVAPV